MDDETRTVFVADDDRPVRMAFSRLLSASGNS